MRLYRKLVMLNHICISANPHEILNWEYLTLSPNIRSNGWKIMTDINTHAFISCLINTLWKNDLQNVEKSKRVYTFFVILVCTLSRICLHSIHYIISISKNGTQNYQTIRPNNFNLKKFNNIILQSIFNLHL